jgi:hypothetical protein
MFRYSILLMESRHFPAPVPTRNHAPLLKLGSASITGVWSYFVRKCQIYCCLKRLQLISEGSQILLPSHFTRYTLFSDNCFYLYISLENAHISRYSVYHTGGSSELSPNSPIPPLIQPRPSVHLTASKPQPNGSWELNLTPVCSKLFKCSYIRLQR